MTTAAAQTVPVVDVVTPAEQPEETPVPEQAEAPSPQPENQPQIPPEINRTRSAERHRRIQIASGIEPIFGMVSAGQFSDAELMQQIRPWAEKFNCEQENLPQLLEYLKLADKIVDKRFSPEERVKVFAPLAELVIDGTFDAETLHSLVYKVVKLGPSGTADVCTYGQHGPIIGVHDELFQDIGGKPPNITHVIKGHEPSHGLIRYGKICQDDDSRDEVGKMIKDVGNLRSRGSYRDVAAIDEYLKTRDRADVTAEEMSEIQTWLSGEILAEKVAAYLQSGGEFSGFITAIWRVTPPENLRKLMTDKAALADWKEENRFFFDKIKQQMSDKSGVKAKILASTESSKKTINEAKIGREDLGDDECFSGIMGAGLRDPGAPDNQKHGQNSADSGILEASILFLQSFADGVGEATGNK
ncbi:MAG: hypothetical protein WCG99_03100 [Candidatus Berkelbacteria bacterium]